jgi:solute carrier family 35 protein C2
MMLFEFRVVQLASGLTLSIAGVFKEVLTIVSSVLIFGDQLTPFNVAGLLICLAGIGGYQRLKLLEAHARALGAPSACECEPITSPANNAADDAFDAEDAASERSPAETRALSLAFSASTSSLDDDERYRLPASATARGE